MEGVSGEQKGDICNTLNKDNFKKQIKATSMDVEKWELSYPLGDQIELCNHLV